MSLSEDMYLEQPDSDEGFIPAKGEMNTLGLAEANLRYTLDLIRFADQKAQNLMRITLALFTVAFIGVPPAVIAVQKSVQEGGGWRLALFIGTIILYAACSGCLLGSLICIVRVIRPRREQGGDRKSVLFFDSVAKMPLDEFIQMLKTMTYDRALTEMGIQIHQSAKIARSKYAAVDAAIRWLLHGVLIGMVFALILLVFVGWLWK